MMFQCLNQKSKKCCGRGFLNFEGSDDDLKAIKFCSVCGEKDVNIVAATPQEETRLWDLKIHKNQNIGEEDEKIIN